MIKAAPERYVLMVVSGSDRPDHVRVTSHVFKNEVAAYGAFMFLNGFGNSIKAIVIED